MMLKLKVVKLLSFLWVGSLAGAGMAFITQVMIARILDVGQFGSFSSALATVTLVAPLAGIGVPALWLKVFGAEGWGGLRWVKPSFNFVLMSCAGVMTALCVWGWVHEEESSPIFYILSVVVLGQICIELVSSKLQLEERFGTLALWQLVPHLIRFLFLVSAWHYVDKGLTPGGISVIYSTVAFLMMVLSYRPLVDMAKGSLRLKGHKDRGVGIADVPTWRTVASQSWPFGIGAFAHLIYFQSDIILLKYLVGDEAAGSYNVAFTVMTAVYLLPSVLYQKFLLPKIHRWSAHDTSKFYLVYRKGNIVMLVFGLIAAGSIWLGSDLFIIMVFGSEYADSAKLLSILAFSSPLISVALSAGSTLVTSENIRLKVKYMLAVALFNLVLNLAVIPHWGAIGAAYTTLLSNMLLMLLYIYGAEFKVFGARR